ncbi:MAG: hypothetical protein K9W44_13640 [Candidatus Lokiarchaeota archaeon]|nr:hypothetical protein [Candidatus Harpocratesius repetitus]
MALTSIISRDSIKKDDDFKRKFTEKFHEKCPVPILIQNSLISWWNDAQIVLSGWAVYRNLFLIPPKNQRKRTSASDI